MQHIPHHSLEDIERSRAEMADFMNKKPVWPNLTLSGEDIHRAYHRAFPASTSAQWDNLDSDVQEGYQEIAAELNRELDARQAWFEGEKDAVTISAVRCSTCGEMLQGEHAEGHACWLEDSCSTQS